MRNFAVPYNPPTPETYPATFGGITQQQPTLEAKLQEWLGEVTHETTLSLMNSGVTDPSMFPAVAAGVAQGVCAEGSPPDCPQSAILAKLYGMMAQMAFADVTPTQWNKATFTDTGTPDVVPASAPAVFTLFGNSTGDGDYALGNLAIDQLTAGTLKSGATAVNPADNKTYTLVAAKELMGWGGYWSGA